MAEPLIQTGNREKTETVLVTGASGFLGSRLCHALVSQGDYTVKAFVRPSSSLQYLPPSDRLEIVYGDVTDPQSLVRALHGCSIVFHCAALVAPWIPDPSKFFTVNVDGVKNVISAVRQTATIKKLIYVSSFFALGPSDGKVADESQMHPGVDFCTEYERSKVLADAIVMQEVKNGLPAVVVYPGVVYGPGQTTEANSLVSLIVLRCSGFLPGKVGTLENKFSFVHVDDVAEGCIAAMRSGKLGERYLLTGDNASFIELLTLIDAIKGRTSYNFQVPIWALKLVGWVSVLWAKLTGYTPIISSPMVHVFLKQWCYSHEKAKRELGYESRPLRQGIGEFLAWMESTGLLRKQRKSPNHKS